MAYQGVHPETALNGMFDEFDKIVHNQYDDRCKQIKNWCKSQTKIIQDHAEQQTRLVHGEYKKQQADIIGTRNQFIATMRSDRVRTNYSEIQELLRKCQALKFELLQFDHAPAKTYFINFMTQESLAEKKRIEKQANLNEFDPYGNSNVNSTPSTPSAPSSQARANNSVSNYSTPNATNNFSDSNNRGYSDNVALDKCPTCLMLFPRNMSDYDRTIHISEHR